MINLSLSLRQRAALQRALVVAARSTTTATPRSPSQWLCRASPQLSKPVRVLTTSSDPSHHVATSSPSSSPSSSTTTAATRRQHAEYHHDAFQSDILPPTTSQLRSIMIQSAIPMVGFGLMDQTLMIHAGNTIDCTIGVALGLSTLAAAAVGQIVANTGALLFGETLEHFFTRFMWMKPTGLNAAQLALPVIEKARFSGTFLGLIAGCVLGLANLLFIDTQRSSDLKMTKALTENGVGENTVPFEVYVSNKHTLSNKHQPATTLTICGPNMDGILAIMLSALKEEGYSVIEISAKPKDTAKKTYEEVFVLRRRGEAIPEEELSLLANRLLRERIAIPVESTTDAASGRHHDE